MFTWKATTSSVTITTPPPKPVSAPSSPATKDPRRTNGTKKSVVTRIGWKDAESKPICALQHARPGLASLSEQNRKKDHVKQRHDRDRQFQDKRPRFIESVDHKIVELAHGPKLFVHQIAIFGNAQPRRRHPIDARVIDVAHKLDGVVDSLRELHHIEANGVEPLGVARQAPSLQKQIPFGFEGIVNVRQQA